MKKILLITLASTLLTISGCSINLGGSSHTPSKKSDVVYDCSAITDTAQKELSKRHKICGEESFSEISSCRDQVIASICKPVFKQQNTHN
jgi:hypothetical protein